MIKLSTNTGVVYFKIFDVATGTKHIATYEKLDQALKHERRLLEIAVIESLFPDRKDKDQQR
jgi:hypothetical protein